MASARIVGLYRVPDAPEPCHMIEMAVTDGAGPIDLSQITQEVPNQPRQNWQVPYSERLVSADGTAILTEEFEAEERPELWIGAYRLVFFFHYLDSSASLVTPFGHLRLPSVEDVPHRLSAISYEAP